MVTFVEEARADREHPVFLAYSLGKAQEAMKILSHWRYKFSVDRSIFDICRIYEEFGIKFGDYRLLEEGHVKDRIVIVPPQAKRSSLLRDIPRKRIAMLTGWAMDPGPLKHLAGCQCIPLSDHADFSELLEYADKAKPEKIYTVHGFPELVEFLNQKGYDAEFLKQGSQPGTAFDQELPGNYDLFAKG
jgi:Cft2 family RNA processing exonuclease